MPSSRPDSSVASAPKTSIIPTIGGADFALAVLFGMNLLNYIDRYSFFAVGTQIKQQFDIDDFWYSVLGVAFMVVYTLVSPVMGVLGDRYHRRMLLAGGVGLWSLATVGTAFSRDFYHMFFWRALLGVGEASYGVIAPSLIADLFPREKRGRAMGVYYLALPLGGALGYAIGSWVGQEFGWQKAFFVVGLPGFLAALAALVIIDPGRGASEGLHTGKADRPGLSEYLGLFKIPTFLFNTAGMAAVTFATGAYAVHGANFYQIVRGMTMKEAGLSIGMLAALAGLLGIALGTFLADYSLRFTKRAYLLLACVAVALAVPLGLFAVLEPHRATSLGLLFGAMVMLSIVLGPCNTVIANVVPANKRASGYAALHLLDSRLRRYQLAAHPGGDLGLLRQSERGPVADRSILRRDRRDTCRQRESHRRNALRWPRAGPGRLVLSLWFQASGARSEPRPPGGDRGCRWADGFSLRRCLNAARVPGRSPARSGRRR